jgi:hypothetical protein
VFSFVIVVFFGLELTCACRPAGGLSPNDSAQVKCRVLRDGRARVRFFDVQQCSADFFVRDINETPNPDISWIQIALVSREDAARG